MIRAAVVEDAVAIGELHNRTWWRAYQDVIDPAALYERVQTDKSQMWASVISGGESDVRVADIEGVRGVISVCADRMGVGPEWGEIAALYVEPAAQGAGVGSALHDHGLELLRQRGFTGATLWTFRDNGQGRVFYEARGWTLEEGSEALNPPDWLAPAVRYRRPL